MNTLYLCLLAAFGAGVLGFIMAYINHRKDYANTDNGASPFSMMILFLARLVHFLDCGLVAILV